MIIVLNNCWYINNINYFKSNYIIEPFRKINYNNSDKKFAESFLDNNFS